MIRWAAPIWDTGSLPFRVSNLKFIFTNITVLMLVAWQTFQRHETSACKRYSCIQSLQTHVSRQLLRDAEQNDGQLNSTHLNSWWYEAKHRYSSHCSHTGMQWLLFQCIVIFFFYKYASIKLSKEILLKAEEVCVCVGVGAGEVWGIRFSGPGQQSRLRSDKESIRSTAGKWNMLLQKQLPWLGLTQVRCRQSSSGMKGLFVAKKWASPDALNTHLPFFGGKG